MIRLAGPFRHALPDDVGALAELTNFAGEGLPLVVWTHLVEAGESPWEVGRRRARRDEGSFSWRNAVVAEMNGAVVACLIGYPLQDPPAPVDYAEMPAMFRPLQELEDLAAGTWYVNVVATYPEYRGQGLGAGLLGIAEELATESGAKGLSLIVADSNEGARRLYERSGYATRAKRPMVKEDWQTEGENWILLVKE